MNRDFAEKAAPQATPDFLRDDAETSFYGNALEALSAVAPSGSTVKAIGFDSVDMFLRAGYRAVECDADVVIARGGEREFELARNDNCKKLILCPTHAYAAAATRTYRATDSVFSYMETGVKPVAVVFDVNDVDKNLASIFGEFLALDLCAFDCAFGARMRGEQIDGSAESVARMVSELTDALRPVDKDRARAAAVLVEYGKKAARLTEKYPRLLHASGAAQMAESIRMLYHAEDRALSMRGETEAMLYGYLIDFYIKNLEGGQIEFPPDNNKRITRLCEYFKADVRRACIYASAIYPPLKMRLCEYRRDEFRAEFLHMLSAIKRRRIAAWGIFKRLYPDDGYCLKTMIDTSDIGICLALAPDVFPADSMLSFLKQTGRLEKYIV